jgi:hypothetical protein
MISLGLCRSRHHQYNIELDRLKFLVIINKGGNYEEAMGPKTALP